MRAILAIGAGLIVIGLRLLAEKIWKEVPDKKGRL